jgi:hypothetical protein
VKPIVENYDGKKFSWECQPGMSGLFFLIPIPFAFDEYSGIFLSTGLDFVTVQNRF